MRFPRGSSAGAAPSTCSPRCPPVGGGSCTGAWSASGVSPRRCSWRPRRRERDAAVAADGLKEIALLFLRLGTTAFGGPAAHIALMEDEVVRRRRWLSREEFLDLLGATNLIPGPNSTEMAIHVGHRRAGAAGLVVAGVCFILPAALITLAAAWAYVRFGR